MSTLAELVETMRLQELGMSAVRAGLLLLPFLVAIVVLEGRAGADLTRYKTRNFLNDVVYSLFYRGAFYHILIFAAVANAFESKLQFLKFDLLASAPLWLALLVFWVVGDFLLYWVHRLQHSVPLLWAFHSVHHSQERLTTLTQYRRHPFDRLLLDVALFVVFVFALGLPTRTWMPLYVLATSLQALHHTELDWRFGPLYRIVVSPIFHSVHHSADPKDHNKNLGQMLSLWDHVFGTAAAHAERPERYGVDGLDMPESLPHQLVVPFRQLVRRSVAAPSSKTAESFSGGHRPS